MCLSTLRLFFAISVLLQQELHEKRVLLVPRLLCANDGVQITRSCQVSDLFTSLPDSHEANGCSG